MKTTNITSFTIIALWLTIQLTPAATTQSVVAPGSATVEGDTSANPLDITGYGRFQQVYGSSYFGSYTGGIWINDIYFRGDSNGRDFWGDVTNVEITISTTLRQPDGLSSVFDDNVGSDVQTIVSRTDAFFINVSPGGLGPRLHIGGSFAYYPSQGNLLLEIKNYGAVHTSPFDAVSSTADYSSSVYWYSFTGMPDTDGREALAWSRFLSLSPFLSPRAFFCFCLASQSSA